jgi:hypothetical protein
MQFPRIHLNGSHGPSLLEQYDDAIAALKTAQSFLRVIDVNNRDYYIISADAGTAAFAEHHARLKALDTITAELMTIAENIDAQLYDLKR